MRVTGLASGRMVKAMLLHKGKYLCGLCGIEVDMTADERRLVVIKASSGGKPNMRVITLDGSDLHTCEMGTAWRKRESRES